MSKYQKMKAAIEGALRIRSLWLPASDPDNLQPEFDHEYQALARMEEMFLEAVSDDSAKQKSTSRN